jgi:hypothetical protein
MNLSAEGSKYAKEASPGINSAFGLTVKWRRKFGIPVLAQRRVIVSDLPARRVAIP